MLLSVALVCLAVPAALSQTPLSFEVASVRLNSTLPMAGPGVQIRGVQIRAEQFEATRYPLRALIALAHGVTRIEGAPDWTQTENYDIRAKAPKPSSRQEMLQMLQTLLAERFHLRAHREVRTMDIYGLVFARPDNSLGPTLHRVTVDCETNRITEGVDPGIFPRDARLPCGQISVRTALAAGPALNTQRHSAVTIHRLAETLSGGVGRPVFDRTGLAGTFDVELSFVREMPSVPGITFPPAAQPPQGVSLRDAIKQQLGLDLRSERGPVEFFVIDAIRQPDPN